MTKEWPEERENRLRHLWNVEGLSASAIARQMGTTRSAILGKSRRLNLQFRGHRAVKLSPEHDAVKQGRTLFPGRVMPGAPGMLKPGDFQRKLGGLITKGHWKGFPVYSLTLEERRTCPRSCKVWASCYGNGMHYSSRYQPGPLFEEYLWRQLNGLQLCHPKGFVVRLHILGDFYSTTYVDFWRGALKDFPALHIFGYTAWPSGTPIGDAVAKLRDTRWRRFAVRTSGASEGLRANVVENAAQASMDGSIVCPAQTNKTQSCSTCALCWQTKKPIAFLRH